MLYMRAWCRDPSNDEVFCDAFQLNSRIFPTAQMAADAIYHVYAHFAPDIEVVKIIQLRLIEAEF